MAVSKMQEDGKGKQQRTGVWGRSGSDSSKQAGRAGNLQKGTKENRTQSPVPAWGMVNQKQG